MTDATPVPTLEHRIDIAAPVSRVWELVSDLPRMASWSPQVVRTTVAGGVVREGATFKNFNRQGVLRWPTAGKVVRYVEGREIAFRIKENKTIWSFTLADDGQGGTRVVQRREAPDGISTVSKVLTKAILGGPEKFTATLNSGMQQTLSRLKAEAESGA